MSFEIGLLGPLEIKADGELIGISAPRTRRLLAVMLLNPGSIVSTDRLIDALWDSPPQTARQQVHNALGPLRSLLRDHDGPDIATVDLGYRIDVYPEQVDLSVFRSLRQQAAEATAVGKATEAIRALESAQKLWRGPALFGLEGSYFESFASRLEEERLSSLELLLELQVRDGDGSEVTGELMELVAEHPLRESLRASLMAALYAAGRQTDALAVYETGRRVLADDFGLDPGVRLRELHTKILEGRELESFGSKSTRRGPAEATATAPLTASESGAARIRQPVDAVRRARGQRRFLPHEARGFAGRARELSRLLEDSRQSGQTSLVISAINGMGGIGKTALAVRFAHSVAEDYPDGQFFVDLRSFTMGKEPMSADEALGLLLGQQGTAGELIPPDVDGRAALWRAEMAGRRAIVVLDNAGGLDQVRPLLPGANGPLVLITSRRRLPELEGALSLPLELMPLDDAVQLFVTAVGDARVEGREDAVCEIVELCGRLPLAIRIAGARFRERTSWTLDYLAALLSDQQRRSRFLGLGESSVSAVLALSCRYLTEQQQRTFRLLSLLPGPDITAPAAAAAAGISADQAQDILETLFDANLILEREPGRYYLHDLVRDAAVMLCAQDEDEASLLLASRQVIDFHLQCGTAWGAALAQGPFRFTPKIEYPVDLIETPRDPAEAIEVLMREYVNLTEVARFALDLGDARRAWQLVCAMQPLLRRTNYAGPALELFEGALAAARADGDLSGQSMCLTGLAGALSERRQTDRAEDCLEEALTISRRTGEQTFEMYQLANLGGLLTADERYPKALATFREALRIESGHEDEGLRATLGNNMGVVCTELGLFREADEYLATALSTHLASGRRDESEIYIRLNRGGLRLYQGRYMEATTDFLRAVALASKVHLTRIEAVAYGGLCVSARATGDLPGALDHGRRALALAREHRLAQAECDALNALGETHLAARDDASAATVFGFAAEVAAKHRLRSAAARASEGFAHLALRRGDEEAVSGFERALGIYPEEVVERTFCEPHRARPQNAVTFCPRCLCAEPS
ncbi:AfsR/SARP family transcriptional regulator [Kitasatospora sp. LaBMicrA B282]|uniref:AfsR/SARP family transcriptional regulator n=1 Tax=Kitasatospora sp. LaBMicrA B282 TaxID=3420949 RepID=UPI003D1277A2